VGFAENESADLITNCFFDTQTTGLQYGVSNNTAATGVSGKTTTEMQVRATFTVALWNFDNIWAICENENNGYPFLRWQGLDDCGIKTSVVRTQGIASVPNIVGYYSILGQRLTRELESGIYIILYDDGTAVKVVR